MGPKWTQIYKGTNKYRLNIIYGFAEQNRRYSSRNYFYKKQLKLFYKIDLDFFK